MEKIYGYKKSDVLGLIEYLKLKGEGSLSKAFEGYANLTGKAKGTVRNLYYAVAKTSRTDNDFCQKYLDGKPLDVGEIVEFSDVEESELIKEILIKRNDGRSVRSVINELALGDAKLALRYQNKFRSAIKNKPELINEIIESLKKEGVSVKYPEKRKPLDNVSVSHIETLKTEINDLFERVALKVKYENKCLKERVYALENENLRLKKFIHGETFADALGYFGSRGGQDVLN